MSVSDAAVDFAAPNHTVGRASTSTAEGAAQPQLAVVDGTHQRSGSSRATNFRWWLTIQTRLLLVADATAALLAVLVTTFYPDALEPQGAAGWLLVASVAAIGWPMAIAVLHGYDRRRLSVGGDRGPVITAAISVIAGCALLSTWFGFDWLLSTVAVAAPAAAIISSGVRIAVRRAHRNRQRSGSQRRRVIMVGGLEAVQDLCAAVDREDAAGMEVCGVCVPESQVARAQAMGLRAVGTLDNVASVAVKTDCDTVAVTGADATRQSFLRELAWSLEDVDVDLMVHPGLVDVARPRMHIHSYSNLALLHVDQPQFSGWGKRIKRATDLVLTGFGVALISPLLAAIALAVKLDDPRGPVIFRQTRVGIDGKPFTMYKFRSMVVDAEKRLAELMERNEGAGPLFKLEHDPRVTRIGHFLRRYSLDELPQLFNVLSGSMSLVGPRPPLQSEVDEYAENVRRRLKVIPGVTGLWQVSGRSMLSWEESVRLDLQYVENWSMGMDLKILVRTAYAVLGKQGAY